MDTDLVEQYGSDAAVGAIDSGTEPDAAGVTIDEVDRLLDEVEAALTRLDEGTYGVCDRCGGPIDDGLLAGHPTARSCATCESGGPRSDLDGGESFRDGGPATEDSDAGNDGEAAGAPAEPALPAPSPWSVRAFPES